MPISAEQFKNIHDLVHYLNDLESKVNLLEEQNSALRTSLEEMSTRNADLVAFLKENWPKTSLFHRSFWVRALTIFGHNLVIQLILGALLMILYLAILAPVLVQLFRQMSGSLP